jgi:Uma2 family endonuclease
MTAQQAQRMHVQDYLALDRQSAVKHEYIDGTIVAMAGGSARHNIITTNIAATLHTQVRQRPCTVYSSDMRVSIAQHGFYTYPDVTVVCGQSDYEDSREDTLRNPTLIVEVLSPSTESYDRGKKSQYYRTIASLQEYVLVAQDAFHVEHFTRHSAYQWLFVESVEPEDVLHFTSINCMITLKDIYEKIVFPTDI